MTFSLFSQIVVEEEVTTETVDLFASPSKDSVGNKATAKKRSAGLAMMGNLLIPGLGSKYLGDNKKAFVYFATEVAAITGLAFSKAYSKTTFEDSRAYAYSYANTRSTRKHNDVYWKNIGNEYTKTVDEFNTIQELNRTSDKKYTKEEDSWEWSDDSYQEEYRKMRDTGEKLKVASSFFLGAMVLNRAVSFIDARVSAKRHNESAFSNISFTSEPVSTGAGGNISITKKF